MLHFLLLLTGASALTLRAAPHVVAPAVARASTAVMADRPPFELSLDLPPRGQCSLKFKPLPQYAKSEAVVVIYDLPFGLNVESIDGLAKVTKAGPNGEKVGDILRYCTKWELGLPGGMASPGATIASFSGAGLRYNLGLFDVLKDATKWDDLVDALLSHTPERCDSVTLVFERPVAE